MHITPAASSPTPLRAGGGGMAMVTNDWCITMTTIIGGN